LDRLKKGAATVWVLDDEWLDGAKEVGREGFGERALTVRVLSGGSTLDLSLDSAGRMLAWERGAEGSKADVVVSGPPEAVVDRFFGVPEERRQVSLDGVLHISGDFTRLAVLDFRAIDEDARRVQDGIRAITHYQRRPLTPSSPVAPRSKGTSSPFIDTLGRAAELAEEIVTGNGLGCQVYASQSADPLLNVAFGSAGPDVPMTIETLVPWCCSSKPLFMVPFGQLWEKGVLTPDMRASEFVSYMGLNGKKEIRLRHLLTHTTGVEEPTLGVFLTGGARIRESIAAAPADADAIGRRVNYSPFWAWCALCDVLEAASGRTWESLIADVIYECRLSDTLVALTAEDIDRTTLISQATSPPTPFYIFNDLESASHKLPGASMRGPISDLGRYYENLLQNPRLLNPVTVEALTGRRRVGLTWTSSPTSDWALGFELESRHISPHNVVFGEGCAYRTFGHRGMQSSMGYADPDNDVVVAVFINGMVPLAQNRKRMVMLSNAVYAELGLLSISEAAEAARGVR
jgi:CubicO group peptidase (beta-lactamase class C family)